MSSSTADFREPEMLPDGIVIGLDPCSTSRMPDCESSGYVLNTPARLCGDGPPIDDVGKAGDAVGLRDAVIQVIPEGDTDLAAGLLQTDEGVAALSAEFTAGAAADLTFFHVVTDISLASVGVQGDFGALEHQQQLGFVLMQAPQQLIERLVACFLAEQDIKALRQGALGLVAGTALVLFQIRVQLPQLAAHRSDVFAVVFI